MFAKSKVHCQYCMCPEKLWKPWMKTYHGDECKLYDDFCNIIYELEEAKKPFDNHVITVKCRTSFTGEYNDIDDIEATINELITTHCQDGYMPENYRPLTICK